MDTLPKREAGSDTAPEEGWVGIEEVAANWRALIDQRLAADEDTLFDRR
jgi:hypothetical protein